MSFHPDNSGTEIHKPHEPNERQQMSRKMFRSCLENVHWSRTTFGHPKCATWGNIFVRLAQDSAGHPKQVFAQWEPTESFYETAKKYFTMSYTF